MPVDPVGAGGEGAFHPGLLAMLQPGNLGAAAGLTTGLPLTALTEDTGSPIADIGRGLVSTGLGAGAGALTGSLTGSHLAALLAGGATPILSNYLLSGVMSGDKQQSLPTRDRDFLVRLLSTVGGGAAGGALGGGYGALAGGALGNLAPRMMNALTRNNTELVEKPARMVQKKPHTKYARMLSFVCQGR